MVRTGRRIGRVQQELHVGNVVRLELAHRMCRFIFIRLVVEVWRRRGICMMQRDFLGSEFKVLFSLHEYCSRNTDLMFRTV